MSNEDIKMSDVFPGGIDPSQITIDPECIHDFYDDGVTPNDMIVECILTREAMALQIKELKAALVKIAVKANCGENGLNDQGYFLIQDILEVANSAVDDEVLEQST